jgi:O-antigen/teichoic acid export membrane protein
MRGIDRFNILNKFTVNFLLYSASAGLLKLFGLLVFFHLARKLSPDEYAQFGLLYSVQVLVSTFGVAGVVEYVVSRISTNNFKNTEVEKVASSLLLILTSFVLFLIIFYYLIFKPISNKILIEIILVLMNSIFLTYCSYRTQLERLNGNDKRSLVFSFIVPFSSFLFGVLFFELFYSAQYYFFGALIGTLIPLFLFKEFKLTTNFSQKRLVMLGIVGCLPYIGSAVLGWFSGYGLNHVISINLGESSIATFTFLYPVISILQLVASAMNQAWAPKFFREIHMDVEGEFAKSNNRFFNLMIGVITFLGVAIILFIPLISFHFGGNLLLYTKESIYLFLIVASYVVLPHYWNVQNYYMAYGRGLDLFKNLLISSFFGLFSLMLAIVFYGELGIYIGLFSISLLKTIIIYLQGRKLWDLNFSFRFVYLSLFSLLVLYVVQEIV